MTDPLGRPEQLVVFAEHRAGCTFGPPGIFWRLNYPSAAGTQVRFCRDRDEVQRTCELLERVAQGPVRVERDACLDPSESAGDANTPDVVDAEWWLGLDVADGMRELGLRSEADYGRVYAQIEAAVVRRGNRESQTGVHVPIVIKRPGARVRDV
ncbi:MAG TPA: hypothetical protein VN903_09175 [Polyangia bacterium]|nr:hypothetical protein [Polyangia bacterium]